MASNLPSTCNAISIGTHLLALPPCMPPLCSINVAWAQDRPRNIVATASYCHPATSKHLSPCACCLFRQLAPAHNAPRRPNPKCQPVQWLKSPPRCTHVCVRVCAPTWLLFPYLMPSVLLFPTPPGPSPRTIHTHSQNNVMSLPWPTHPHSVPCRLKGSRARVRDSQRLLGLGHWKVSDPDSASAANLGSTKEGEWMSGQ